MNTHVNTRPPIVAVMGHIDHGKSTLLDYIRKTHVTDTETGNITQHISAYEVGTESESQDQRITFLDTPGHTAFTGTRKRGASLADIAILIIAADDSVQPQTKEALQTIQTAGIPYIVAINKIDKSGADTQKVKQDLLQHEVYLEEFSGDIPSVEISAINGTGIDDLLEVIGLISEMEGYQADINAPAEGVVLESARDPKRGMSATLVIKNGTLQKGDVVTTNKAYAPIRIMENFKGESIDTAQCSSPVKIIGWNQLPHAGTTWHTTSTKKDAEKYITDNAQPAGSTQTPEIATTDDQILIPVIIKADSQSGLEGLEHEIMKHESDRIAIRIIRSEIGNITENDVLFTQTSEHTIIIGFNVKVETNAQTIANRDNIALATFSLIYDASDWLKETIIQRTPTVTEQKTTGTAKIIRQFSQTKNKQVIGGKVLEGKLCLKEHVTIYRRDAEIGHGKITNLQHKKQEATTVEDGVEFGCEIETKIEIQPGDTLEAHTFVET